MVRTRPYHSDPSTSIARCRLIASRPSSHIRRNSASPNGSHAFSRSAGIYEEASEAMGREFKYPGDE